MAILGIIADDFTGATDIAGMLVKGGMRTIQTIGVPAQGRDPRRCRRRRGRAQDALDRRQGRDRPVARRPEGPAGGGLRPFFFKYCSTFDSTDQGNIGPVGDALLDALKGQQAIYCPAFPENGRTIFLATCSSATCSCPTRTCAITRSIR